MKKKHSYLAFLLFFGIIALLTSCLDTDDCTHESYSSPRTFMLKITDEDGTNLITTDMFRPDSIKLYYNDNLGKALVSISFLETIDGNVLISSELPQTILETANSTYFLYLNSSDTDTLLIEVIQGSDGCNTWYYYTNCKYNDEEMALDPETYFFIGIK